MRLILIRHALPVRLADVSEAPDPELSETGHRQVAALVDALAGERIDAVWSSPLRRAVQTATPLAEARGLTLRTHPDLVEFDFGHGVYIPGEETDHPVVREMTARIDAHEPDDGLERFRDTVAAAVADVIAAAEREQTVAIACHGGVVNAFTASVIATRNPIFASIAYTGYSIFTVGRSGRIRLHSLNEHRHVRDLGSTSSGSRVGI